MKACNRCTNIRAMANPAATSPDVDSPVAASPGGAVATRVGAVGGVARRLDMDHLDAASNISGATRARSGPALTSEDLQRKMNSYIGHVRHHPESCVHQLGGQSWQKRLTLVRVILGNRKVEEVWADLSVEERNFVQTMIENLNIGYQRHRFTATDVPAAFATCQDVLLKCQELFDVVGRDDWLAALSHLSDKLKFLTSCHLVCARLVDAVGMRRRGRGGASDSVRCSRGGGCGGASAHAGRSRGGGCASAGL